VEFSGDADSALRQRGVAALGGGGEMSGAWEMDHNRIRVRLIRDVHVLTQTPAEPRCACSSLSVVEEENARLVGSCEGSVVRVEVEGMWGIRCKTRARAVEYENDEKLE
jgi:hypothetical protein